MISKIQEMENFDGCSKRKRRFTSINYAYGASNWRRKKQNTRIMSFRRFADLFAKVSPFPLRAEKKGERSSTIR